MLRGLIVLSLVLVDYKDMCLLIAGRMNHKLESSLLGEISTPSDMQIIAL